MSFSLAIVYLLSSLSYAVTPAAVGSVQPTARPQRFVVSFTTDPKAVRWEFHRCPAAKPCTLLARGPGSQLGATLDEAHAKVGDSYHASCVQPYCIYSIEIGCHGTVKPP